MFVVQYGSDGLGHQFRFSILMSAASFNGSDCQLARYVGIGIIYFGLHLPKARRAQFAFYVLLLQHQKRALI